MVGRGQQAIEFVSSRERMAEFVDALLLWCVISCVSVAARSSHALLRVSFCKLGCLSRGRELVPALLSAMPDDISAKRSKDMIAALRLRGYSSLYGQTRNARLGTSSLPDLILRHTLELHIKRDRLCSQRGRLVGDQDGRYAPNTAAHVGWKQETEKRYVNPCFNIYRLSFGSVAGSDALLCAEQLDNTTRADLLGTASVCRNILRDLTGPALANATPHAASSMHQTSGGHRIIIAYKLSRVRYSFTWARLDGKESKTGTVGE